MTRRLGILYKKELRGLSRDRRSLFWGFLGIFLLPVLLTIPIIGIISDANSPGKTVHLTIESPERAPDLVAYLARRGIEHGQDPEEVVAITLRLDPEFVAKMARGEQAVVRVIGDDSDDDVKRELQQVMRALQRYSTQRAGARLIARGIDPRVIAPLDVQRESSATPKSTGGFILSTVAMMILLIVFMGSNGVVMDLTVGERERKSLTLLLTHPMTTTEIMVAKVGTMVSHLLLCLLLLLVSFSIVYSLVPWEALGFTVDLGPSFILFSLCVGAPLVLLSTSLLSFIALLSRSLKEAQTYMSMMVTLPVVPTLLDAFDFASWLLPWLPMTGQQHALIEFAKGNAVDLPEVMVSALATLVLAALAFWGACRVLRSEKILFGT